jgi:hypothetical protein
MIEGRAKQSTQAIEVWQFLSCLDLRPASVWLEKLLSGLKTTRLAWKQQPHQLSRAAGWG